MAKQNRNPVIVQYDRSTCKWLVKKKTAGGKYFRVVGSYYTFTEAQVARENEVESSDILSSTAVSKANLAGIRRTKRWFEETSQKQRKELPQKYK